MIRFPLPPENHNPLRLADWLEIYSLLRDDETASKGDLASALKLASVFPPGSWEKIEQACLDTFCELEQRAASADTAYPFEVTEPVLKLKPTGAGCHTAYVFCLLLSYFGWKPTERARVKPWKLFEDLSCMAAKHYLGGQFFKFGSRDKDEACSFRKALDSLCRSVGEGNGFRDQPVRGCKDDGVDLVAWRHFKDEMSSKLILFGQCASGANWKEKVNQLQPTIFWDQWMKTPAVSPLLRSFYVPHRISQEEWDSQARKTGILFDRCRIAYWAQKEERDLATDKGLTKWCQAMVKRVKNEYGA